MRKAGVIIHILHFSEYSSAYIDSLCRQEAQYRTVYIRAWCAVDPCASIVGILLGRSFVGLARSLLPLSRFFFSSLASFYSISFFFYSAKSARKPHCQASVANILECDLALIPALYPLNLNNGDRANSSSVAVNLRAYLTIRIQSRDEKSLTKIR